MHKVLLSLVILGLAGHAAAKEYGPAGCGLGTEVVFQDANEWHEHVLAATTNGTSGNQTFGMTSGTLGCETDGPLAKGIGRFISENLEQLAADTAQGHGETLDALAELIGVQGNDKVAFNSALQSNFDNIFPSESATAESSYKALVQIMAQDKALQKYLG